MASSPTSSVAISATNACPVVGWLRNPVFDFHFIVSITILAVMTGCVGVWRPDLFHLFLVLDVWLLGYHHVASTFTRLCFDKESFRQNRFLVIQLPIIVIAGTVAAVYFIGAWTIATTYLYWQWFHYTRQSYGIERMYRRKADANADIDDFVATRVLYSVPIFGILYRSWQQPDEFLGNPIFAFAVPTWLLLVAGVVAAVTTAYWAALQIRAYSNGRLAKAHCLYLISHLVVFLFGYVLIADITAGWLVINIWHNAQYILFVWWFNNKRFERGVDTDSVFLSTISQRENLLVYLGTCLAISTVFYVVLISTTGAVYQTSAVSLTILALMVLNFHHYVVDGIIWKRRRMKAQPA